MKLSQPEGTLLIEGHLAIPFPPQQPIDKIGYGDGGVARESIAPKDIHWVATALRPQSLATQ